MPVAQSKKQKLKDDILKHFSDLFQKTGFDISCKLSSLHEMSNPVFYIYIYIFKLFSVEFSLSVVKVKLETIF